MSQGLVLPVKEGQTGEYLMLGILKLALYQLLCLRLMHHILHQVVGIADSAAHHAGDGVAVLADNAHDLYFQSVIVQRAQAQLLIRQIDILPALLVKLILIGGENVAEAHIADLFIAPALRLGVHRLLIHKGLHIISNAAVGFQAQSVEDQVGDLVIVVYHQHDLIVFLRPCAVQQIILLLQQGVYRLAILAGQHLLPDVHGGIGLSIGGKEFTVIPAVGSAHGVLQKLNNISLDDISVHILGKDIHVQVVGILNRADVLVYLAVFVLDIGLEGFEVVGLLFRGQHGVHHVIHDCAGVHRVLFVLLGRGLGMDAHEGAHQPGHIHALGLDGDGIAGEGVLLDLVDVILYAVGQGHDQSDADNADAPGKGRENGAGLLGQQIVGGEGQGGEKAHGGLFAQARGGLLRLLRGKGIAVPHDLAVMQADDAAGIAVSQLRVVGDHDDELVLGYLLEDLHDLHGGVGVQGAGRLVGQKDIRVVHQGAGDGHALHLAAGHLVGLFVQLIPQAHLFQGLFGSRLPLRRGYAREGQGQLHVGEHGLVRDQVIGLKNEADGVVAVGIPVAVRKILCGLAVDHQIP